jgi:hypothetical protein
MTDKFAELDASLDRVVAAARAHLAAIKAADGEPDDDTVWNAYVELNNASYEYDERLNDVFGEVTPWDVEALSTDEAGSGRPTTLTTTEDADRFDLSRHDDPHPQVVSVRQRRDYRVPSLAALLRVAEEVRPPAADADGVEPIATVAEALLEIMQSGDGSMAMLDVPELEPLDGLVVVAEVVAPLDPETFDASDVEGPFRLAHGDRSIGRLDERAMPDE